MLLPGHHSFSDVFLENLLYGHKDTSVTHNLSEMSIDESQVGSRRDRSNNSPTPDTPIASMQVTKAVKALLAYEKKQAEKKGKQDLIDEDSTKGVYLIVATKKMPEKLRIKPQRVYVDDMSRGSRSRIIIDRSVHSFCFYVVLQSASTPFICGIGSLSNNKRSSARVQRSATGEIGEECV